MTKKRVATNRRKTRKTRSGDTSKNPRLTRSQLAVVIGPNPQERLDWFADQLRHLVTIWVKPRDRPYAEALRILLDNLAKSAPKTKILKEW